MDVDFTVGGPSAVGSTDLTITSPMMAAGGMWPLPLLTQQNTAQPQLQNLFGVVIPGGPVRTDFVPADASGSKFTMQWMPPPSMSTPSSPRGDANSTQAPASKPLSSINEIVAFLLPQVSLPPSYGVLFYWQVSMTSSMSTNGRQAATGFALLGALTPNQPSCVFRTGWSEHEELLEMEIYAMSQMPSGVSPLMVTFGVSLESLDNIQNLPIKTDNERRLYVAQKIATDLFQFMQSFDTGLHGQGQMVVPTNIFDRWMKRFEARFRRDPNFFLKSQS